jgi:hypothetical protein
MKIDTNNESIQNLPRRKLLKGMVAGGSGVSALVVIPERWTSPIVNSVILPAHAETSILVPESCEHSSTTIDPLVEEGLDDILIVYDGATSCDIVTGDVAEDTQTPPDTVIVIDADPEDDLLWDGSNDQGSNWTKTGGNFNDFDNSNGTYYIEVQRAGDSSAKFRVSFRVRIEENGTVSMTVDNIVITAI